ncbi:hypothetical protein EP47_04665 [Legionella norrlandica]|uniref:Lipoprotein n=1 Tax=Legionella norrlandica TaxID=1498499 RepID=A0A0A2SQQ3_9GAMM|nr:hypothetical protein [Legionella norrlandica]KGP63087.1 hypothetical protein EP47_04665 [Legionella norrlandica]
MKRLIIAVVASAPLFLITGCAVDGVAVEEVSYDSGYSNDYVYSVGYYSNRPYWGNNYYYSTSFVGPYGYWGAEYDNY